jgi:DNA-binding transcriptional MocR family regulator
MKIQLDRGSPTPIYLQIVQRLREQILGGMFPEGGRLPPSRKLAETLGINRSTVVQAYNVLWSEGLVESRVGRGTVVRPPADVEPDETPISPPPWRMLFVPEPETVEQEVRGLLELFSHENVISLAAGLPPPELYPMEEIERVTRDVLAREGRALLQWCPVEGYLPLRKLVADRMPGLSPREVLILTGSTQGLFLLARTLIEPGDSVIVEAPTYLGALKAFQSVGARLVGVPVDEKGANMKMLGNVLARTNPKFIYTIPEFQNPTGTSMSLDRRRALLDLAYRYRIPVVEDDPYSPLRYDADPLPSLKDLDTRGHVIHLSTYSKILCPGLRVGWLAAQKPVIERLTATKYLLDILTNTLSQAMVFELSRLGLLEEHMERMRREYRKRRDAMIAALERHCPDLSFIRPEGGYFIWCRLPKGLSAKELLKEALGRGVSFLIGEIFYPDGRGQDRIRLTFTSQPPSAIEEGVRALGEALRHLEIEGAREAVEEETVIRPIV